jgi:Tfp pilus assembly protein PilN
MINLLPPDVKDNYRYARRNSQLMHWIVACGLALVGLAAISVGGMIYLDQTAKDSTKQADTLAVALKNQDEAATRIKVTDIGNNLKLAVDVLSKQVLYSEMLKHIATIIPSNTSLTGLVLSQGQGSLDITADTKDYTTATQLQLNLADAKNKLFTKADIVSITCADGASATQSTKRYPCTVIVRALFARDNPFLFTSGSSGAIKQ